MKLIITAKQSSGHDLCNVVLFKTTEAMGLQYTELMKAGDRPTFFCYCCSSVNPKGSRNKNKAR